MVAGLEATGVDWRKEFEACVATNRIIVGDI
jgi:hypothetical protein